MDPVDASQRNASQGHGSYCVAVTFSCNELIVTRPRPVARALETGTEFRVRLFKQNFGREVSPGFRARGFRGSRENQRVVKRPPREPPKRVHYSD